MILPYLMDRTGLSLKEAVFGKCVYSATVDHTGRRQRYMKQLGCSHISHENWYISPPVQQNGKQYKPPTGKLTLREAESSIYTSYMSTER